MSRQLAEPHKAAAVEILAEAIRTACVGEPCFAVADPARCAQCPRLQEYLQKSGARDAILALRARHHAALHG